MLQINAASMRKSAAFIRGRRLITFLLVPAGCQCRKRFTWKGVGDLLCALSET